MDAILAVGGSVTKRGGLGHSTRHFGGGRTSKSGGSTTGRGRNTIPGKNYRTTRRPR